MDILQLLWLPFLVSVVLIGIHTYFGLHVLARNVVFVDLALAQIAALGATVAFMLGHAPQTLSAYGYSFGFTLMGALLLSLSRGWSGGRISQEALVGIIYVVSSAAAVLLIDQAPQGAEHLKQILTGSILSSTEKDLALMLGLYLVVGVLLWLLRKPLLRSSFERDDASPHIFWWDLLFYALFGIVVTSSVAVAGVLLVFSFLIIPAAIGRLYSNRIGAMMRIGWIAGIGASALGLALSYGANLPTGAAMVCVFGGALAVAAALKPALATDAAIRKKFGRTLGRLLGKTSLAIVFISALWLVAMPRADHPLLDTLEYIAPSLRLAFLSPHERELNQLALREELKAQQEATRLAQKERDSRWQGQALSDHEVRRISSFTQSFLEMKKGEQMVQREMRNHARERQRWVLGIPALLLCVAAFIWMKNPPARD